MSKIFISYSHKNSNFVDLLQKGVEIAGRTVWRDIDHIRGGQVMDREVGIAIDNAALFITVISEHFDQSPWLHHELARAIASNVPVVPIVVDGVIPPVTVSGSKQVRISIADDSIPSPELLGLIAEIDQVAGYSMPTDYDDDDMNSSDADWIGAADLEDELVGSRWTWCENSEYLDTGLWIEFEANGRLRRSWRTEVGQWKVARNGFVVYKPHILMFDCQCQSFQGATADPAQPIPERSGLRIK